MRKSVIAGAAVAVFAAAQTAPAKEATVTVKLGGGMLYNKEARAQKTHPGLHVSLDLRVPGRKIALSPFGDVYWRSGKTTMLGGVHVFAKPPMRTDALRLYFGAGGGLAREKQGATVAGAPASKAENTKLLDLVAGAEIKITRTISFFVEPRYVKADSKTLSGLAAHAGLSVEMM